MMCKYKTFISQLEVSKCFFRFTKDLPGDISRLVKRDQKLLSSAVLMVALRIIHVSDRIHNRVFDAISTELGDEEAAFKLNKLSAILFEFVKLENAY